MVEIYVAQQLIGKNLVDVSLKSGLYIFKPYSEYYKNVVRVIEKRMSYEALTQPYLEQMRRSYKNNTELWHWFLKQNTIIFGCNCGRVDRLCHAFYLANNIFKKFEEVKFLGWKEVVEN